MEGAVASVAGGALKTVLEKLAALLVDKYKRFKGVRRKIKSLKAELEAIYAFLEKMSDIEDFHSQDKVWMVEVQELCYDIEDSIDEFMLRVDDKSVKPNGGFIEKLCKKVWTKKMTHLKIAREIDDLNIQVKQVGKRHKRYKIHETICKTNNATVDHRALVIFKDASELIGIDGPKDELIELMMHGDACISSQQPKVVSIVGSPGLGKTTLAKQVYEKLGEQFECKSFVSVSRNPDMMRILKIILNDVSNQGYASIVEGDMQHLISKIRYFLEDKRYLVVIDDVWKIDVWDIIKCALFKNNKDSKIIVTTRICEVAESCCSSYDYVYKIRPLGSVDSKRLFCKRIFGSEDEFPLLLIEAGNKILKKCDGLPLAIISIAGLLANKPRTQRQWDQVQSSIGRTLEKSGHIDRMIQIISLSYFDLPHHLKACLLYLSIFPEDSIIEKNLLVRRWIAEGFIHEEHGHNLYDLGERCFNELINRSLIQPWNINFYGEAKDCRVHDAILDFIIFKSGEENFVTISGDSYHILGSHEKVRRLSLNNFNNHVGSVSLRTKLNLSHARSIYVSTNSSELPSLSDMRFLRVVDLGDYRKLEYHQLADIENLFQLKYLNLRNTRIAELPTQIGKLQYLETLDLRKTDVTVLPATFIGLQRLAHLAVDYDVKLPDGIGSMASLEYLKSVNVFRQSIKCLQELGQLKHLKSLRLFFGYYEYYEKYATESSYKEYLDSTIISVGRLSRYNLGSVSIKCNDDRCAGDLPLDLFGKGTSSSLWKFILPTRKTFISKIPNWMGSLISLRQLSLCVKKFEVVNLLALGRLTTLEHLQILALVSFEGRKVTINSHDGFKNLRCLLFGCAIPVTFAAGAMPKLNTLELLFSLEKTQMLAHNVGLSLGIQHLSSLQKIYCSIYNVKVEDQKLEETFLALKDAIARAVHSNPNKFPLLNLDKTNDWTWRRMRAKRNKERLRVAVLVSKAAQQFINGLPLGPVG